jgi:hypothetical protein
MLSKIFGEYKKFFGELQEKLSKLCGGREWNVDRPRVGADGETLSAGAAGVVPFEQSDLHARHVVMIRY